MNAYCFFIFLLSDNKHLNNLGDDLKISLEAELHARHLHAPVPAKAHHASHAGDQAWFASRSYPAMQGLSHRLPQSIGTCLPWMGPTRLHYHSYSTTVPSYMYERGLTSTHTSSPAYSSASRMPCPTTSPTSYSLPAAHPMQLSVRKHIYPVDPTVQTNAYPFEPMNQASLMPPQYVPTHSTFLCVFSFY